jgi:hypothetical protein
MGFVYLLICVDNEGQETHKIGISKNSPSELPTNVKTICGLRNQSLY